MSNNDGYPQGKHFDGVERIALIIITIIPPLIMLPLTMFIVYMYAKYNTKIPDGLPMFKTTVAFIIVTMLFYIIYITRGINICYGDFTYESHIISAATPIYGGHFLLFIILLFHRLCQIFNDSQYKLHKCTINMFYILVVLGLIFGLLFAVFMFFDNNGNWWRLFLSIGLMTILFTYVWISSLYIIKLFKVMRDTINSNFNTDHSQLSASSAHAFAASKKANEQILASITKYTLLTTISLLTNLSYIAFTMRPKHSYVHHIQMCFALLLWQASISVNIVGFALGFHFSQSLYTKICIWPDKTCKSCFEFMAYFTLERKETKDEINIALEIQETASEPNIEYPEQSPPPQIHQIQKIQNNVQSMEHDHEQNGDV